MWPSMGNVNRGEMATACSALLSMTDRQTMAHCRLFVFLGVDVLIKDLFTVTPCSLVGGNRSFR
jgi:hypothetical protein